MAITQLSPIATPGKPYLFAAKRPKGPGIFTALSVSATPGARHSFVAKAPYIPPIPPPAPVYGAGGAGGSEPEEWKLIQETLHRESVLKDDAELMELIGAIVPFL